MKTCAAKNKVSTGKLLDAVELQEKQAMERVAMGLPAAPPIQQKKTVSKKLVGDIKSIRICFIQLIQTIHFTDIRQGPAATVGSGALNVPSRSAGE